MVDVDFIQVNKQNKVNDHINRHNLNSVMRGKVANDYKVNVHLNILVEASLNDKNLVENIQNELFSVVKNLNNILFVVLTTFLKNNFYLNEQEIVRRILFVGADLNMEKIENFFRM